LVARCEPIVKDDYLPILTACKGKNNKIFVKIQKKSFLKVIFKSKNRKTPLIVIMQAKKINIIFILFILNYSFALSLEIKSMLENNLFLTRSLNKEPQYSFCLIDGFDLKNSESIIDFSFENKFIKAGRINRQGIWRELFSPLGASANSDLFNESIGFDNNYLFNKGGLYGLSLEKEEGTGISLLFPDNLWLGANYSRVFDFLLLTSFISVSVNSNKPEEEWRSTYSVVPNTNPIHFGIHSVVQLPNFTLDYLGALSGSSIYKAGSYNRLFFELFGRLVSLKGFGGIVSPYFINTNLKLSDSKYLLSLYLWLRLSNNLEVIFKTDYQEDHEPVLPVAYIPTSGASSAKLIYDNSFFIFDTEIGQKFGFDIYGNESLENSIDGKLGMSDKYSAFFYYDYTFNFNRIIKRKFEIQFKANYKFTDLEFVLIHCEEIYEPVDEKKIRLRVDQILGTGDVFFKIEFRTNGILEGFALGFSTDIHQKE